MLQRRPVVAPGTFSAALRFAECLQCGCCVMRAQPLPREAGVATTGHDGAATTHQHSHSRFPSVSFVLTASPSPVPFRRICTLHVPDWARGARGVQTDDETAEFGTKNMHGACEARGPSSPSGESHDRACRVSEEPHKIGSKVGSR